MSSFTAEKLQSDIVAAMKAKDSFTTTTLRLVKSAIQNKAKEKQSELTEDEVQAVLATMVKQRKDSIQQFTDGGRVDLAMKEAGEIDILAKYMPRELTTDEIDVFVRAAMSDLAATEGYWPTQKDMGTVMKKCQAWLREHSSRADGKVLSSKIREHLK